MTALVGGCKLRWAEARAPRHNGTVARGPQGVG
jgi:hypothetical protein